MAQFARAAKPQPRLGLETGESTKWKRIDFEPDTPVKLHVRTVGAELDVYIHRSRLAKVFPGFERAATYHETIELDHVAPDTLRAFGRWIYEDIIDVEVLQDEMVSATERTAQADSASQTIIEDLTEDMEEDKEEDEEDNLDSRSQKISGSREVLIPRRNSDPWDDDDSDSMRSSIPDEEEEPAWYLTSSLDVRGIIFGRLLDLYMFGITYQVESFQLSVILTWQRFSYATRTY